MSKALLLLASTALAVLSVCGAALAMALVVGLVATSGSAGAGTFPGANGRIVYSEDRAAGGEDYEIYTVGPNGGTPRRVTNNVLDEVGPVWSPDGTKIAYFGPLISSHPERFIFRIPAGGGKRTLLTSINASEPTFSPDGTKIAFVSEDYDERTSKIYTVPTAGGEPTEVFDPTNQVDYMDYPGDPAWSPNGSRIAFSARDGDNWEIYTIPVGGGSPKKLTNTQGRDNNHPVWSPNGSKIAYHRSGFTSNPDYPYFDQIFTVPVNGGRSTQVTRNTSGLYRGAVTPAWSPDGRRIAFSALTGPPHYHANIITTSPTGKVPVSVTKNTRSYWLDWQSR